MKKKVTGAKYLRCGTSLVEVLLFTGFFAVCAGVLIPILSFSGEQRVRQQTIALVDQEGAQLLQMLVRRARRAEKVLLPPIGGQNSAAAFQMTDQSQDPTIIALQGGSLVAAEHSTVRTISSDRITITQLLFRNTSASSEKQSIQISFVVEGTIPIPTAGKYTRTFETLVVLFTDNDLSGNACGCSPPVCSDGILTWGACDGEICSAVDKTLPCG